MTPQVAQWALSFMDRVQLTGQEVPAWNAVTAALREAAQQRADAMTNTHFGDEIERT